jgi:hypothetical protein
MIIVGAGIPAVVCHVDAAAEGERIVDHHDLLVMRGPRRVGAVESELEAASAHPIQEVEWRSSARQGAKEPQIPLQHPNAELWPAPTEFRQERPKLLRQARQRVIGIELDASIELPADEQDRMAGAQESAAQMSEVCGSIDDRGKTRCPLDTPAGQAWLQQLCAACERDRCRVGWMMHQRVSFSRYLLAASSRWHDAGFALAPRYEPAPTRRVPDVNRGGEGRGSVPLEGRLRWSTGL